jgi:hypothetical protein
LATLDRGFAHVGNWSSSRWCPHDRAAPTPTWWLNPCAAPHLHANGAPISSPDDGCEVSDDRPRVPSPAPLSTTPGLTHLLPPAAGAPTPPGRRRGELLDCFGRRRRWPDFVRTEEEKDDGEEVEDGEVNYRPGEVVAWCGPGAARPTVQNQSLTWPNQCPKQPICIRGNLPGFAKLEGLSDPD